MTAIAREDVLKALSDFRDPETGRDVVRLNQVSDVTVRDGQVDVTLGLTTLSAPLWSELQEEAKNLLTSRLPVGTEINVKITQHHRPAEKLGAIGLTAKAVIAVGSGKGGVGKSTVATALALGLARSGSQVGLMDADVYGPSVPHLLGATERPTLYEGKIQPINVDGLRVMSMGFIVPKDEAVIWRGPMLHGAVQQFLKDTAWGELDYLIVDMPPGTGDIALSLSQLLPVSGAIVVCTPQELALLDAVKAVAMFRKVNIEVLGMVENMSWFVCPDCGSRHEIFGTGGAKKKAAELDVPFLGEIPLNVSLRIQGDIGRLVECFSDPVSAPAMEEVCRNLVRNLTSKRRSEPQLPTLSVLG
ncbi:Mrp/NBP35 family ATP-binding protein [Thermopirellula anaerolimosa]